MLEVEKETQTSVVLGSRSMLLYERQVSVVQIVFICGDSSCVPRVGGMLIAHLLPICLHDIRVSGSRNAPMEEV